MLLPQGFFLRARRHGFPPAEPNSRRPGIRAKRVYPARKNRMKGSGLTKKNGRSEDRTLRYSQLHSRSCRKKSAVFYPLVSCYADFESALFSVLFFTPEGVSLCEESEFFTSLPVVELSGRLTSAAEASAGLVSFATEPEGALLPLSVT
jgi:hypothetical protein